MYGVTPVPLALVGGQKKGKRKMHEVYGTQVWIFPFMKSPAVEGLTS